MLCHDAADTPQHSQRLWSLILTWRVSSLVSLYIGKSPDVLDSKSTTASALVAVKKIAGTSYGGAAGNANRLLHISEVRAEDGGVDGGTCESQMVPDESRRRSTTMIEGKKGEKEEDGISFRPRQGKDSRGMKCAEKMTMILLFDFIIYHRRDAICHGTSHTLTSLLHANTTSC
jgi:hypothetical protein